MFSEVNDFKTETDTSYAGAYDGVELEKDETDYDKLWHDIWAVLKPALIGAVAGTLTYGVIQSGKQKIYKQNITKAYDLGYNTAKFEDSIYIDGMERGFLCQNKN